MLPLVVPEKGVHPRIAYFLRVEEEAIMARLVIEGNTIRTIEQTETPKPQTIRIKSKGKNGRKVIRLYHSPENQRLLMDVQVDHRKIAPLIEEMSQRAKDRVCTIIFFFSVLVLVLSSCQYLSLTNTLSLHERDISRKEKQLAEMHLINENLQHEINKAIDLHSLYQVATQELGMVPAQSEDVITYRAKSAGYIRQYDQVPAHEETTPVAQVLQFLHIK